MIKEIIGNATIYCGDCRELWQEVEPGSVDLLLTDPPYGIENNNPTSLNFRRFYIFKKGVSTTIGATIKGDGKDDFLSLFNDFLISIKPLMANTSTCLCFCSGGGSSNLGYPIFCQQIEAICNHGYKLMQALVWDKMTIGMGLYYRRSYEFILYFNTKKSQKFMPTNMYIESNILHYPNSTANRQHPNEKPLPLIMRLVENHTEKGDLVFDPFMGSGTTGVAALKMGRKFIGFELERKYFDVACRRLERANYEQSLMQADEATIQRFKQAQFKLIRQVEVKEHGL